MSWCLYRRSKKQNGEVKRNEKLLETKSVRIAATVLLLLLCCALSLTLFRGRILVFRLVPNDRVYAHRMWCVCALFTYSSLVSAICFNVYVSFFRARFDSMSECICYCCCCSFFSNAGLFLMVPRFLVTKMKNILQSMLLDGRRRRHHHFALAHYVWYMQHTISIIIYQRPICLCVFLRLFFFSTENKRDYTEKNAFKKHCSAKDIFFRCVPLLSVSLFVFFSGCGLFVKYKPWNSPWGRNVLSYSLSSVCTHMRSFSPFLFPIFFGFLTVALSLAQTQFHSIQFMHSYAAFFSFPRTFFLLSIA